MPKIFQSFIQSDYLPTLGQIHPDFEAVIQYNDMLVHYTRINRESAIADSFRAAYWQRIGPVVYSGVGGAGCIIQSDLGTGVHKNFEVAVPIVNGSQLDLWHYYHNNAVTISPYVKNLLIASNVAGPASFIQSDFISNGARQFDLVVPIYNGGGGMDLWHYTKDNSTYSAPWVAQEVVAANVAGPGSIIQSDFVSGGHGNFEVVVPHPNASGTMDLWHYSRDNSSVLNPWIAKELIFSGVTGPAVIIQSDFGFPPHGNFELTVPIGSTMWHFFRNNTTLAAWQPAQYITQIANGWSSLMRSDYRYGTALQKTFEVLVEETPASVTGYYHSNKSITLPWLRSQCPVTGANPSYYAENTHKICQLTGEYDLQGWDGVSAKNFAFNRTESTIASDGQPLGLQGTDLGASFEHNGRACFLFGDSWRTRTVDSRGDDAIAFSSDTVPTPGVHLTFNPTPPIITDPANQTLNLRSFNVPLDGFSYNGVMYVFFSTGSSYVANTNALFGNSYCGVSLDNGLTFNPVHIVSQRNFLNVSVSIGPTVEPLTTIFGLSPTDSLLWGFGTGRYRSSSPYLAVMPLKVFEPTLSGPFPRVVWGGTGWKILEGAAVPLIAASDVGELSVRYNPVLSRWIMLYNSIDHHGIVMHSAPNPWGPWTRQPVMIYDPTQLAVKFNPCSGNGYGKFIHLSYAVADCDNLMDNLAVPPDRTNTSGGVYGPYQIERYTTANPDGSAQIYFTMSTWNPYQAVLMTATITQEMMNVL